MLKKITIATLIGLQMILLLAIPLTKAQSGEDSPPPAPEANEADLDTATAQDHSEADEDTAEAQDTTPKYSTVNFDISNYLKAPGQGGKYLESQNPVASFIVQVINFLVMVIGSLAFLLLVVGGFILVTSNGNENSVNKGKEVIKFAIIGLIVVFGAYIIIAFAQSIFYELPGN